MKYFLHDTSAFEDEKISELFIKFGYEGLGLFYTLLEKIAKQEKPVKTDVLKHQLKVGKKLEKCWKFMEEIGLILTLNGETFNEQLLNFSEKYKIKKEKNAKKITEWRRNQIDIKNVTGYEPKCNDAKVKESKVNNIVYTYSQFYDEQIELSQNDKFYTLFVKWLFGDNIYKRPLEKVLNMKEQVTWKQFPSLLDIHNETGVKIRTLLEELENWLMKNPKAKNSTVLGTIRTFAKRAKTEKR